MRLSQYFLPILREVPKEAEIVSHRLMLPAGVIRPEAAGIYAWLPLGFRVLQKIAQIVREQRGRPGRPRSNSGCHPCGLPTGGGKRAATMRTARKCCGSPIATKGNCFMGQ